MARRKRTPPDINASSMADIAFLLLVFFLVTTTMDTPFGVARRLPPPIKDIVDPPKLKQRNVFVVLANANDQLLVESEPMDISLLRERAKEFIANPNRKDDLPEWEDINVSLAQQKLAQAEAAGKVDKIKKWKKRLDAAKVLGPFTTTKQVISLQNHRGTSYELYIRIQNELAAAYRELRDEFAMAKFGKNFDKLPEDQFNAVKTVFPQKISEAEPVNVKVAG